MTSLAYNLQFLKPQDVEKIHSGALHLLEKIGLHVESLQAADILDGSGASVNRKGNIYHARIPPSMVEDCITSAPRSVTYYGREEVHDFMFQTGEIAFADFGQCVNIMDPSTGKVRPSQKSDMAESARLQDALSTFERLPAQCHRAINFRLRRPFTVSMPLCATQVNTSVAALQTVERSR